jgi:hypothetical protein
MSTMIEQLNKNTSSLQNAKNVIENIQNSIEEHRYYAVYYDKDLFYVGKVTKVEGSEVCVKFLERGAGNLRWPKRDKIETIDIRYIFYGPIDLKGVDPFTADIEAINIAYKLYKKYFD